jgi:hypothetical protein
MLKEKARRRVLRATLKLKGKRKRTRLMEFRQLNPQRFFRIITQCLVIMVQEEALMKSSQLSHSILTRVLITN